MKNLRALFLFMVITVSLNAQAPEMFNYQGIARTLSGEVISGQNIGLRIAILQNAPGGPEVYKEVHLVQTNNFGLFTIQIGNGSPLVGTIAAIDWGAETHFLQIEMDENGGSNYQLIGTSQLLSVPYALHAKNGSKWEDVIEPPMSFGDIGETGLKFQHGTTTLYLGQSIEETLSYPTHPTFSMRENYSDLGENFLGMTLIRRAEYNDKPTLEFIFAASLGLERNFSFRTNGTSKFFIKGNGNIGIGTVTPQAKLQVSNGDIYIENVNKGVIMKSPNGQCWRMTVNNSGQPEFTSIPCP